MKKEDIIKLIEDRIKSEHRKYKDLESVGVLRGWEKIAAHKIYASLFFKHVV